MYIYFSLCSESVVISMYVNVMYVMLLNVCMYIICNADIFLLQEMLKKKYVYSAEKLTNSECLVD